MVFRIVGKGLLLDPLDSVPGSTTDFGGYTAAVKVYAKDGLLYRQAYGETAVVIATLADLTALATAASVTAEAGTRAAADATLTTNLATEVTDRGTAVTAEAVLRAAGDASAIRVVLHGSDPDVARPDAIQVRWIGTVLPNNAIEGDERINPEDTGASGFLESAQIILVHRMFG